MSFEHGKQMSRWKGTPLKAYGQPRYKSRWSGNRPRPRRSQPKWILGSVILLLVSMVLTVLALAQQPALTPEAEALRKYQREQQVDAVFRKLDPLVEQRIQASVLWAEQRRTEQDLRRALRKAGCADLVDNIDEREVRTQERFFWYACVRLAPRDGIPGIPGQREEAERLYEMFLRQETYIRELRTRLRKELVWEVAKEHLGLTEKQEEAAKAILRNKYKKRR